MYTTRRATIGHFFHHSGHGPCDDGPSIRPASSYRVKSSKRVLSSGDYFYFCNRKNKLVGGRIHILWIDYDPKSILKFLVFWDTERHTLCNKNSDLNFLENFTTKGGRGYLPIFSRILLEKVGGTYLSLIFLRGPW